MPFRVFHACLTRKVLSAFPICATTPRYSYVELFGSLKLASRDDVCSAPTLWYALDAPATGTYQLQALWPAQGVRIYRDCESNVTVGDCAASSWRGILEAGRYLIAASSNPMLIPGAGSFILGQLFFPPVNDNCTAGRNSFLAFLFLLRLTCYSPPVTHPRSCVLPVQLCVLC